MTSYKKLYEKLKKEYDALQGACIDLRKPNLTILFKQDKWDWEIQDVGLVVSKNGGEP